VNEQEKVETRFARAETYWNASFQVMLSSNRHYLGSLAVVRTTAGLVSKRELVNVQPGIALGPGAPRRQTDMQDLLMRIAPWAFIGILTAAAMGAIFFVLPAVAR
jgi:hypothetical protein